MFEKTLLLTVPKELAEVTGISGTFKIKRFTARELAENMQYGKKVIDAEGGETEYAAFDIAQNYADSVILEYPEGVTTVRDIDWEITKWIVENAEIFNRPLDQTFSIKSDGAANTEHKTLI